MPTEVPNVNLCDIDDIVCHLNLYSSFYRAETADPHSIRANRISISIWHIHRAIKNSES